ncbi:uncharacterized protein KY384_006890 [Bacidia gigantensis]|uniref:uncharacterized protein n=1 Tax=Bacidia gigantensis TaxID=2732470 RepID=UPI001D046D7A|nr:uncharacterized protein KY384_006890 [Bacidia gigantensis]KAG8527974.1 hypothetical protein KY384_006890 [Bacidia gigantensis]
MAPKPPALETSSAPLADWFFICGVDSEQLHWGDDDDTDENGLSTPFEPTIEEDKIAEAEHAPPDPPVQSPRKTKRSSYQRLSNLSDEARLSIASLTLSGDKKGTDSNRSSVTIKGPQVNGTNATNTWTETDFENALKKFAAQRDSFLVDLDLTAGAVVPSRPKPRPKTQRIITEDAPGTRSGIGSIRRRLSTRTLNSAKRQTSVKRQSSHVLFVLTCIATSSARTSKRLSNYNSVIPNPQPLNEEANTHPLMRKFEPVLLDRYPQKSMVDEMKRRGTFPDYVPMFAFPNDVNILSADERPRSTWHGFAMTSSDNSRLYGICLTVWIPLNERASGQLERECEKWRKNNMTGEERELASSLGERLALERVKLSRLLASLPSAPSGSDEREALEDEISAVEEKIALMADLLRPVRHGAAAKIEGLTDGETGLWIPRAYGILGRDTSLTSFWKEWLKAVVVPMTDGAIVRVPISSPTVGTWQPLERYVVNLCAEAPSPISSKTQVEVYIRELRLFARKEALNELPGSRNFALAEARIILLSSHTSMLHLASKALIELMWPLKWSGVFIPVLPARLIQAIEAPCPYIVGIERRYEKVELPEDDFVLVDLDQDEIESTVRPLPMPKQQRRKLTSILQAAAPHHNRFGVPKGPPAYAIEAFPFNTFTSENPPVFSGTPQPTSLARYIAANSTSFGDDSSNLPARYLVFNAFSPSKITDSSSQGRSSTGSTNTTASPPSPKASPVSSTFPAFPPSRSESGHAIQASLREKRSGHFDSSSRRSSTLAFDRNPTRRPSIPSHTSNLSISNTISSYATSNYAPSMYAQSTLAASTIMPNVLMQPVRNTDSTCWAEGHCLQWRRYDDKSTCTICDEKAEDGIYKCSGCSIYAHTRCAQQICVVCPAAFHPEQVRAAFARCFAALFYTYRKSLQPANKEQKKSGLLFSFNMDGFIRSLPHENADYVKDVLKETQCFNEFIHEGETKPASDPSIMLLDQMILSKRNRGRASMFSKSRVDFLSDTYDHLWRSAAATPPKGRIPGDYRATITRTPAKLDPTLMKEPRALQGVPRINTVNARSRKPIPSMLGPGNRMNGLAQSPPT